MRRLGILLTLLLFITFSASAAGDATDTDTSLLALRYNALTSVSRYGSFNDIFINPASLPLLSQSTEYQVSYGLGESYDTSLWGKENMSHMQNLSSELQGTVVSGPVALSAKVSSLLDNRILRDDGFAHYDIYSSFDVELALAYSFFSHFSIGARLGGGNSVARLSKKMTGILSAVGNAWFSPYEKMNGSERFNVNIGTLVYTDNFTFGLVFDDLFQSSTSSNFLDRFLSSTTVSFSYKGNAFNSDGDLNYLLPRVSVDLRGVGFNKGARSVVVAADLTLQFLKDVLLDMGVKYAYMVSAEDARTGAVTATVSGTYGDFSLLLNLVFLQNTKENFRPSLVFTYST